MHLSQDVFLGYPEALVLKLVLQVFEETEEGKNDPGVLNSQGSGCLNSL